jgi:hypothetical protein
MDDARHPRRNAGRSRLNGAIVERRFADVDDLLIVAELLGGVQVEVDYSLILDGW